MFGFKKNRTPSRSSAFISAAAITAAVLLGGCSDTNTVPASDDLNIVFSEINDERSVTSVSKITYPSQVEEIDSTHLRYKNTSEYHPYTVTFSKIFSKLNSSVVSVSDSGISLSTEDGKAALKIEYVYIEEATRSDIMKYLIKKYGIQNIQTDDNNNVIVKTHITDSHKNSVAAYMKAVIEDYGYTQTVLCFHDGEEEKYNRLLNDIEITVSE